MKDTQLTLKHTPLYSHHKALGARMVPFAGWEMPIQYVGIVAEHHAVRRACGLFDVSHMGRFIFSGTDVADYLRRLVTYDVAKLAPGRAHYALLGNEDGGILDDIFIYRLSDTEFRVVVNAANADSDERWLQVHWPPSTQATATNQQRETVMLALQGPQAAERLKELLPGLPAQLKPRRCDLADWEGNSVLIARTGYTGEDGFELISEATAGIALWERLTDMGVQPCGLGARDTLRLEAALALYGNDIDTTTNPYEAGLGWVVSLDDDTDFIGKKVLKAIQARGVTRQLVCLRAEAPGVPRAACRIIHNDQEVGRVTSGGPSPTLGTGIAMGYVPTALAEAGTLLDIDVRGRLLPVHVVPRPFYRRSEDPST